MADQCAESSLAWDIAYYTDKSVNCYNYLKDENESMIYKLPIAGAYLVIISYIESTFIVLAHQITHNKSRYENKSLALLF